MAYPQTKSIIAPGVTRNIVRYKNCARDMIRVHADTLGPNGRVRRPRAFLLARILSSAGKADRGALDRADRRDLGLGNASSRSAGVGDPLGPGTGSLPRGRRGAHGQPSRG